ncbi:uncharacterized protein LOC121712768 [Alosa sapidissima]|uniref:uncharacterized protein LOC121712768 n=1 Tax=Alosa sapidissima TaxID=34773 RepID=UPI001C098AAB|nr:uncharacterized protein LOC121712768 [Alosa sapidissima]
MLGFELRTKTSWKVQFIFNLTLLAMLRNLDDEAKADWKSSLAKVVHAFNCTRNESTGYAPYYLPFGLPIDLMFGIPPSDGSASHQEYAKKWRRRMEEAYQFSFQGDKGRPEYFIGICCSPLISCQWRWTLQKRIEVRSNTNRKSHDQHSTRNPSLHLTVKRMNGDASLDGPKEIPPDKPGATSERMLQSSSLRRQHQHLRETTGWKDRTCGHQMQTETRTT